MQDDERVPEFAWFPQGGMSVAPSLGQTDWNQRGYLVGPVAVPGPTAWDMQCPAGGTACFGVRVLSPKGDSGQEAEVSLPGRRTAGWGNRGLGWVPAMCFLLHKLEGAWQPLHVLESAHFPPLPYFRPWKMLQALQRQWAFFPEGLR